MSLEPTAEEWVLWNAGKKLLALIAHRKRLSTTLTEAREAFGERPYNAHREREDKIAALTRERDEAVKRRDHWANVTDHAKSMLRSLQKEHNSALARLEAAEKVVEAAKLLADDHEFGETGTMRQDHLKIAREALAAYDTLKAEGGVGKTKDVNIGKTTFMCGSPPPAEEEKP